MLPHFPTLRLSKRHRRVAILLAFLVGLSFIGTFSLVLAAVDSQLVDIVDRRDHEAVVRAMEKQVTLIQWIGGAIVTSLTAAVGMLFRALEKANAQSREDLVEGIKRRETLVETMIKSNNEVTMEVRTMNADVRALISEVRGR